MGLAVTTTFGWGFRSRPDGTGLRVVGDHHMAYYSIRHGLVELHKEWMIRAYVVTFAFVFFRILSDYGPTSHLQPENDQKSDDHMGLLGCAPRRH